MFKKLLSAGSLFCLLFGLVACGRQITPVPELATTTATTTSTEVPAIKTATATVAATPTEAPANYAGLPRTGDRTWVQVFPSITQNMFFNGLSNIKCPGVKICYASGQEGQVLITNDGGLNWQKIATGVNEHTNIVACPTITTCFVTKQYGGMIVTQDAGKTWQAVDYGSREKINRIECPDKNTCYAVGTYGLIVTTVDRGQTWVYRSSTTSMNLGDVSCPTITICYAVGGRGDFWSQQLAGKPVESILLVTNDGGNSWKTLSTDNDQVPARLDCPGTKTCYGLAGYVGDTTHVPISIKKSTDGGQTWINTGKAIAPGVIKCPGEMQCYIGNYSGTISVTDNGGQSWIEQSPRIDPYYDVSCPALKLCFFVSESGSIIVNG
jgi:photosystem II stability/assembly factor-like uncharacterized protein